MAILRRCIAFAVMAAPAGSLFSESFASATPVTKVLDMLKDMKAKGEEMMQSEKATYATYKVWVEDRTKELNFEISTAEREIEQLAAFIEKADSDTQRLTVSIAKLNKEIATLEGEKAQAISVREEEHAVFVVDEKDHGESVDALERALQVLKSQDYDRPQAEALLQGMQKNVPGMPAVLAAFLQEEDEQTGAPDVAAYEFQSGGVVGILEGLLKKFKSEYDDLVKAETNRAHYHQLEVMHLSDLIDKYTKDMQDQEATKGRTVKASVSAQSEKASTEANLAEDQKFLAEMKTTFAAKSATFTANQEVRVAELEALTKAIAIISSPDVAESYKEHVKLAQIASVAPTSFLQRRSATHGASPRERAVELLSTKSKTLASSALAAIAATASAGPFDKVIGMIEDLLAELKEEAAAEANHTAWCNDEVNKTEAEIRDLTAQVSELTAKAENYNSTIAMLASEISTLAAEQQKLAKDMAEATSQRATEKEENEHAISDAKAGIKAVKEAIEILNDFYSKQGSFVQKRQVPEMEAYTGQFSNGVIGMLEVIETDLSRLEAETTAAEEQAATAYKTFMSEAKVNMKMKHDLEYKKILEKDQNEFELSQTNKDIVATNAKLAAANDYYEQLKPSCLEVHVNYEERVAKREEEITALRQAYDILDQKGQA